MTKSPFYRVVMDSDQTDITDRITKLKFEDAVSEDNLLVLNVEKTDNEFIDYISSQKNNWIKFQYGYLAGEKTGNRYCKIKSIEVDYAKTVKIEIKCRDSGYQLKNQTSNIFHNDNSSSIVKYIAGLFNMEFEVTETKEKITIPQGNKTYFEFIKKLAKKEGFDFYVKDNTIFFKPRDLTFSANKLYEYGNASGNVISFKPKYEDNGESNKVSSGGINNDTGELFDLFSTPEDTDESGLGKKYIKFDENGKRLSTFTESGHFENNPDDNANRIKKQTDKQVDDSLLANMTASLKLELDLTVFIEDIITIAGVAKEHSGNWYVMKKTDIISKAGALTDLDISRNATNNQDAGDGTPNNINNSIGDKNGENETEIKVRQYDDKGTQIN